MGAGDPRPLGLRDAFVANKEDGLRLLHAEIEALIDTPGAPVVLETTGLSDAAFLDRLAAERRVLFVRCDVSWAAAGRRIAARPTGQHLSDDPLTTVASGTSSRRTSRRTVVDLVIDTEAVDAGRLDDHGRAVPGRVGLTGGHGWRRIDDQGRAGGLPGRGAHRCAGGGRAGARPVHAADLVPRRRRRGRDLGRRDVAEGPAARGRGPGDDDDPDRDGALQVRQHRRACQHRAVGARSPRAGDRYLGEELGQYYVDNTPSEGSVEVRLRPEHWRTHDYAKGL